MIHTVEYYSAHISIYNEAYIKTYVVRKIAHPIVLKIVYTLEHML